MKEFPSVHAAISYLWERCPPELSMPGAAEGCEWVDCSDTTPGETEWFDFQSDFPGGRILPPQITPYLYRGQTERFTPCRPAIFRSFPPAGRPRDLPVENRLRYMLSEIQVCWFAIETRKHPAWKYAYEIGLQIHHWALAQHYGIATMFLDMTQSIDVAAFFATSDYVNGAWQPRVTGKGVIYRLDFSSIPQAWDRIHLVGLSTFPRPGEQKAWAIPITLQGDFEKLPYVEIIEFTHTEYGSKHYSDMFHRGVDLFPHDPAADLANVIRTNKVLPVNCVANALRGLGCPMDRLQLHFDRLTKAFKEMWGFEVANEVPVGLTDEQIATLSSYWETKGKTFLENVGVRHVAIVKADGPWMNTTDAARLIGCTAADCRKLIHSEQLQAIKAYRLGTRKPRYLVSRKSVERFLNEH